MTSGEDDRRHVTHACDLCRSKKLKCDGTQPCQHCISRVTECVYSERKKRGRHSTKEESATSKKRSRPSKQVIVDKRQVPRTENMVNSYNRLNVLDVYFEKVAPYAGMNSLFDPAALKQPTNKAQTVQLNVALATASLCLDKAELAVQLMSRARLVAGEIFDEVSVDSLLAFGMLTDCFLGRDPRRAGIYSKLAMSIGTVLCEQKVIQDTSQVVRYGCVASYIAGLDEARSMRLPLLDLQGAVDNAEEFGLIMSQCWFGLRLSMLALVVSFHTAFDAKYREMYPEDQKEGFKEVMLNRACVETLSPATHTMDDIFRVLNILNASLCASSGVISDYQFQYWRFKLLAGYAMVHWKRGRINETASSIRLVISKANSLDFRFFPALTSSLLGTMAELCYDMDMAAEMNVFIDHLKVMALNHPIAAKAVPVFEAMYADVQNGHPRHSTDALAFQNDTHSSESAQHYYCELPLGHADNTEDSGSKGDSTGTEGEASLHIDHSDPDLERPFLEDVLTYDLFNDMKYTPLETRALSGDV